MLKQLMMAALAAAMMVGGGCSSAPKGASGAAWASIAEGAPIRVGVYVDRGARSKGMFRWLQLMSLSPDIKMTPIDGEGVRNGELDNVDVLVMPGGRATIEARAMQTNGLERLRAFIRRGGSYVGTCAGCFMLMQYARGEHLCPVIPYTFWREGDNPDGPRGPYLTDGRKNIVFNDKCKAACGLGGTHSIAYAGGPVMWPTGETIPDAKFETFGTYAPDTKTKPPKGKTIGECAACVAGTYGYGRVFVLSVHPEANPDNHEVVQAAFRYVTGRTIRLNEQEKGKDAKKVAFYCQGALGPKLARWAQDLFLNPSYQLLPMNHELLANGELKVQDYPTFVVGAVRDDDVQLKHFDSKKGAERMRKYLDAGGKIVVWGPAKKCAAFATPHANLVLVDDQEEALAALGRVAK